MNDGPGLARVLHEGDYVILSTGAVARTRAAYPLGYTGSIELELDGQRLSELAGRITLPQPEKRDAQSSEPAQNLLETDEPRVRAHDHRMKD